MNRFSRLILIISCLLLSIGVWIFLRSNHIDVLAILRTHQQALQQFVHDQFALAIIGYGLVYALATALSIPGASLLTLTGGWLFGVVPGTIATVIGATIGAVGIFSLARYVFGPLLQSRVRQQDNLVSSIENGFVAHGFSYLLVLRLVPLFPFWLVNLVPAFTKMPIRSYIWATAAGIIPGSLVYVSVGHGLGSVLTQSGAVTPGLLWQPQILLPLIGLSVLALVPVFYQKWHRSAHETKI